MALSAADIAASILRYLETNYVSSQVAWPGREWDASGWDAWIEPHILGLDESDPRRPAARISGSIVINVFRKLPAVESASDNAYTATWLASVLSTLFSHRHVTVRDHVSGNGTTILGVASFGRADVTPMGIRESLEQVSFGAPFWVS